MPSELFEKKLREKLSQATIPPTPELWNNIESELKAGGSKRGVGFWIILALLLLSSIGALWGFWQMNEAADGQAQASFAQREVLAAPIAPSPTVDNIHESPNAKPSNTELENSSLIDHSPNTPVRPNSALLKKEKNQTAGYTDSNETDISNHISTSRNQQTNYDQQTISSESQTYSSAVLSKDLSEEISSQVPQHTNPALQESHILPETSSISSKEEIVEVAGLQHNLSFPLANTLNPTGIDLPFPKQEFRKKWAFLIYMDSHYDLGNVSLGDFLTKSSDANPLAFEGNDRLFNVNEPSDPYAYQGLNTPGNLTVYTPEKSISFGLQAEWKFHPKFSLRTGVEYGYFSLGNYTVGIFAGTDALPSPINSVSSVLSRRSTLFAYHQLGIPLQLNYQFLAKGRSSLNVYGGVSLYAARAYSKSILQSANFYDFAESAQDIGADGTASLRNAVSDDVPRLLQYNPLNLTTHVGIDYFYHFSDKFSFFLGPQLKYQATPIYREQQAEINEVPLYLGLRLGFRFAK